MRLSLKLVLILILPLSFLGCQSHPHEVHQEIRTVASDSADAQDASKESLQDAKAQEPDMALVEKRRAQLAKTFATGEGCPNCEKKVKDKEETMTACPHCSHCPHCTQPSEDKACPCYPKNGSGQPCTCGQDKA